MTSPTIPIRMNLSDFLHGKKVKSIWSQIPANTHRHQAVVSFDDGTQLIFIPNGDGFLWEVKVVRTEQVGEGQHYQLDTKDDD